MPATAVDPRTQLQDQGFVVLRGVIPAEVIALAQAILGTWVEAMIARWIGEGRLDQAPHDHDFRTRFLTAWNGAGRPRYERSPRGDLVPLAPTALFRLLTHPALLDIAQDLLGSDRLISHGIWNSRPKAPDQSYTDTPWHQDAQYFPDQAQRRMANCWFPLHAVDATTSCLAMAPDAHRDGLAERYDDPSGFIGIPPEARGRLEEVALPMEAGDCVWFTNLTPHRAMSNRGDRMRWSFDLRFAAHGDEERWPLGQGIVARHPDPALLTAMTDWRASWPR